MTNFNKPDLSSREVDAIDEYKARDVSIAQMFDAGTNTNIPENSIRFNVVAGVFQRRESGSWVTKALSNDALNDVLSNAGTFGSSIAIPQLTINSKGRITAASTNTVRSASTSQTGVVQLSDAVNSTLVRAATSTAVKSANDKATPKTLTGATTNSSDGSGHTHNITVSDAIDENNSNQLATSAAVNALKESIDYEYYEINVAGVGDFTTGSDSLVKFTKIFNIVTVSFPANMGHQSSAFPSTGSGFFPDQFSPASNDGVSAIGSSVNNILTTMRIDNINAISFDYRSDSGANDTVDRTSTGSNELTISYRVN